MVLLPSGVSRVALAWKGSIFGAAIKKLRSALRLRKHKSGIVQKSEGFGDGLPGVEGCAKRGKRDEAKSV